MGVMNSVLDMLRWRRLGKHSRYEDRDLSQKYGLGVHQGDQIQEARLRQSRGHMENVQEDPMDPQQLRRRDPPPDWKGAAGEMEGKPGDRGVKPREESASRREWTTVSNAAKEVKQDKI